MRRSTEVMATSLEDETVLLDPRTGEMFTLNATGAVVWDTIDEGVDAAISRIVDVFDIDVETAREDVTDLVAELRGRGLIDESGS